MPDNSKSPRRSGPGGSGGAGPGTPRTRVAPWILIAVAVTALLAFNQFSSGGNRGQVTYSEYRAYVAAGAVTGTGYDMIVAPVDLTLRAAIALKSQTDHPILLVDQLGRLAGLCGNEEIYRGLLRKQS